MTRETAQNAMSRIRAWERRQSNKIREEIFVPYFGSCGCRMHNSMLHFEQGHNEPGLTKGKNHAELYKLGKKYEYLQAEIWKTYNRLYSAFAKHLIFV